MAAVLVHDLHDGYREHPLTNGRTRTSPQYIASVKPRYSYITRLAGSLMTVVTWLSLYAAVALERRVLTNLVILLTNVITLLTNLVTAYSCGTTATLCGP